MADIETSDEKFVDRDGDHPNLRDKWVRRIVFGVVTALILGLPLVISIVIGNAVQLPWPFSVCIGLVIGGELYAMVLPRRLLNITPEAQALITQNIFGGGLVAYGPGLTIPFLWENKTVQSNYSLQVINRPFAIPVPTKTGQVTFTGNFQYSGVLDKIVRIVRADETQIDDGFTAYIEAFLTDHVTDLTLEEARGEIQNLNEKLREQFMGLKVKTTSPEEGPKETHAGAEFLDRFGIKTFVIQIRNVQLPPAVQKTQDAKAEAEALKEIVAGLFGLKVETLNQKLEKGEITREEYQKMLEYALSTSENATMNVNVYRGDVLKPIGSVLDKIADKFTAGGGKNNG